MALLIAKNDGNIKVISSKDSSVNCDSDEYEKYQKTLDEEILQLDGVPTRFVLRKNLNYKEQKIIKDAQVQMKGKNVSLSLSYMMEEVRLCLIDIENPPDLPEGQQIVFKKAEDGKASYELIAFLEQCGISSELYAARSGAVGILSNADKKK